MNSTTTEIIKRYTERFGATILVDTVMFSQVKEYLLAEIEAARREGEPIDHSIDVRYEEDVIEAFNKFIKKWCGSSYAHLIDSDEQDGEFMREKIESELQRAKEEGRLGAIEEMNKAIEDSFFEMQPTNDSMNYVRLLRKKMKSLKPTEEECLERCICHVEVGKIKQTECQHCRKV